MTTKAFDLYDLSSTMVSPTAPTPAPTQATRRGSDRLMRGGIYLLTFACALMIAGLVVMASPLGRIDADITVPVVAAVAAGLVAIAWAVTR